MCEADDNTEYIRMLGSDSDRIRKEAAQSLADAGEPQWKQWVRGVDYASDFRRLVDSGEHRAFIALQEGLKSTKELVRNEAARCLSLINPACEKAPHRCSECGALIRFPRLCSACAQELYSVAFIGRASYGHKMIETIKMTETAQGVDDLASNLVHHLTSNLAKDLRILRNRFYGECLGLSAVEECRNKTPRPQPSLSNDGHFVVGSLELSEVFSLVVEQTQQARWPWFDRLPDWVFSHLMYAKVFGPYAKGELDDSVAKGVTMFLGLTHEEGGPYEEMYQRMKEIIFTGSCDMYGEYRSDLSLGISGMNFEALDSGLTDVTTALLLRTLIATALAFEDQELADEQRKVFQEWASAQPGTWSI